MIIFPRPYPSPRARSAHRGGAIVAVAAPADLRNLHVVGRRRPAAAWTIDPASRRPVCVWGPIAEDLGRGEDAEAQSRFRSFPRHVARPTARDAICFRRTSVVIKASCC